MARIVAGVLVCAVLCLSGCSLTYKKRVIKEADIGQTQVMEYGLLGIPGTPNDQPGGLLPIYRSETPWNQP